MVQSRFSCSSQSLARQGTTYYLIDFAAYRITMPCLILNKMGHGATTNTFYVYKSRFSLSMGVNGHGGHCEHRHFEVLVGAREDLLQERRQKVSKEVDWDSLFAF